MKAAPDKKTNAAPARPAAPARSPQEQPVAPSTTEAAAPGSTSLLGLGPGGLRMLQSRAGNAAVSRLVAQRLAEAPAPPVKPPPSASPAFTNLKSEVRAKKTAASQHSPAAKESKSAQDAAVAPPDDKQAQGKAAQAEKMNAAKPGVFDKAGFIAAVNQAITAQAPKNLDEADDFAGSGKAAAVKDQVNGKVAQGKETSAQDIDATTKAAPDLSAAKDKQVTPLTPDAAPATPGAPNPAGAVPAKQPDDVTDFSGGPDQINQQMTDAEVTEDQLAKSNEPQFTGALTAKQQGEQHSATAPGEARGAEAKQLAAAKQGAAAAGTQAMTGLAATRAATGKQVDGGKSAAKSADEKKRAEVTAKLQKVFDATTTDVEKTLTGLDTLVDEKFTAGEKSARDAFTADHKRRMDAYKDKRYGGRWGWIDWGKDKLLGLPEEANQLFQESRKLYVAQMQQVISGIADTIGTELGKAKDRIAKGRIELKAEVDRLPADLKKFGQEAAADFTEKFDGLESDVNAKSDQLVQDLAQKYNQALNAVDDEIKKLQEENKGLVDKAKDAVVGVIQTILELKNMLLGVLAKAASAVMKIVKDPIGFLSNLVSAVGAGLHQFIGNIEEHLKKGLVSWLLGTAVSAGLALPAKFDLKGIIQLLGGLLGLTWSNIRARITSKGVPEPAMDAAVKAVPVAQALQKEDGPAGAVEHIKASVGDLKSTILQQLTKYLIPTVLTAGITWIVSLLNPASAFVRAVKGIIDIVTFVVTQGAQIIQFVNSILDAVIAIANGGQAGVPALIEGALVASIPVLIGFLAALLGVGNLANKVKEVFHAAARPVGKAIDKIVDFVAKTAKKLWSKLKGSPPNKSKHKPADERSSWWSSRKGLRAPNGESHTLLFRGQGKSATLVIRSNEQEYRKYIESVIVPDTDTLRTPAKEQAFQSLEEIEKVRTQNIGEKLKAQKISSLMTQLAHATSKLIGDGGTLPESTPPIYGGVSSGGFATTMTVTVLTKLGQAGSPPDPGMESPIWDILLTRHEKATSKRRFYKLGHLLSFRTHGPGNIWANLTPQSESGNQKFERQAEKQVKEHLAQGKGLRYSVTVRYGRTIDKSKIVNEWRIANDPDIAQKEKILDAEEHVPVAFDWEYEVVFDKGRRVTGGASASGSAENDIRQEAGKYHIQ